MKGYITKHRKGHTLTIVDNSGCKHHFIVKDLNRLCKEVTKTPLSKIRSMNIGIGQFITDKLGFGFDCELDIMGRYEFYHT